MEDKLKLLRQKKAESLLGGGKDIEVCNQKLLIDRNDGK